MSSGTVQSRQRALANVEKAMKNAFLVMCIHVPIGHPGRGPLSLAMYQLRDAAKKAGRETERWAHARKASR